MQEELLIKLSMLEQQAQETGEKIRMINDQVNEMENLKRSLRMLEKSEGKEMLAPLGRGIFLKTEIKENKVFVNVGSKTLVKKNFGEAGEIVDGQLNELERIKVHLMRDLQNVNNSLASLIEEARSVS